MKAESGRESARAVLFSGKPPARLEIAGARLCGVCGGGVDFENEASSMWVGACPAQDVMAGADGIREISGQGAQRKLRCGDDELVSRCAGFATREVHSEAQVWRRAHDRGDRRRFVVEH